MGTLNQSLDLSPNGGGNISFGGYGLGYIAANGYWYVHGGLRLNGSDVGNTINNTGPIGITTSLGAGLHIADPSGDMSMDGQLAVSGAARFGSGIKVSGASSRIGQATLTNGAATVADTTVTANTRIFVAVSATGGTPGLLSTTKSAGNSFTITSTSSADTSTVDWMLVEQY